jgi:hypothetical protein
LTPLNTFLAIFYKTVALTLKRTMEEAERNHADAKAAFWKKPNGRERGSDSTWHLEPNGSPFKKSGKTFKQGRGKMLEKWVESIL